MLLVVVVGINRIVLLVVVFIVQGKNGTYQVYWPIVRRVNSNISRCGYFSGCCYRWQPPQQVPAALLSMMARLLPYCIQKYSRNALWAPMSKSAGVNPAPRFDGDAEVATAAAGYCGVVVDVVAIPYPKITTKWPVSTGEQISRIWPPVKFLRAGQSQKTIWPPAL